MKCKVDEILIPDYSVKTHCRKRKSKEIKKMKDSIESIKENLLPEGETKPDELNKILKKIKRGLKGKEYDFMKTVEDKLIYEYFVPKFITYATTLMKKRSLIKEFPDPGNRYEYLKTLFFREHIKDSKFSLPDIYKLLILEITLKELSN